MTRIERLRAMEHQRSLRELARVDGELSSSRADLVSSQSDVLTRASRAPLNAGSLAEAATYRMSLEKRIARLSEAREQVASQSRALALAHKQVEVLVTRQREQRLAEVDTREARTMDELAAQAWRRR